MLLLTLQAIHRNARRSHSKAQQAVSESKSVSTPRGPSSGSDYRNWVPSLHTRGYPSYSLDVSWYRLGAAQWIPHSDLFVCALEQPPPPMIQNRMYYFILFLRPIQFQTTFARKNLLKNQMSQESCHVICHPESTYSQFRNKKDLTRNSQII
jgi:hypothetical protein